MVHRLDVCVMIEAATTTRTGTVTKVIGMMIQAATTTRTSTVREFIQQVAIADITALETGHPENSIVYAIHADEAVTLPETVQGTLE